MGAWIMAIGAVGLVASALVAALRDRRGPKVPDVPTPGAGETVLTCPICKRTFKQQSGTYLQTHPPCPWPKGAPGPLIPVKPVDPHVDPTPGPDPKPLIVVPPKPDEPPKADPLRILPVPTPGASYQVKSGDTGSALCVKAYPGRPKPSLTWAKVAAHPLNAWLLGHVSNGAEVGGFWPKWSGYGSKWQSGSRFGQYYFPNEEELP